MAANDGVSAMRPIPAGFAIPVQGSLALKSSSIHMILVGRGELLKAGQQESLTLLFEEAGTGTVDFAVQPMGAVPAMGGQAMGARTSP